MVSNAIALAHEVRSALNIVELAASAHGKRDAALRDHLIRSLELPLLESMANGRLDDSMSPSMAANLSLSIPLQAADDAEMMADSESLPSEMDTHPSTMSSRVVSRVYSMRILASYPREIPWIRWSVRLDRVKMELIGILKTQLVSVRETESMAMGVGV